MVRKGLRLLLMAFDDLELVGETDSGVEAVRLCEERQPDVVVMDMVMPGVNGIEATRQIVNLFPHIKVVALTSYQNITSVQQAVQAGATGYLMKDVSIDQLADGIRSAHAGKPVFDETALHALIKATTSPPSLLLSLTDREKEILALMVDGLNNPAIAERLTIGRSTVKTHVSNILQKLNVKNRLEAVALVNQNSWQL